MPAAKLRVNKATALERLTTKYVRESGRTEVRFDEHCIGSIVQYGKYVGTSRSKVNTVYGSRIYGSREFGSVRIEEEAGSMRAVMNKVAVAVARGFKDGSIKWEGKSAQPAVTEEPELEASVAPSPNVNSNF